MKLRQAGALFAACLCFVPIAAAQYVDSAICAGCHREIARTFSQTGMGRSASRGAVSGNSQANLYHEVSDRHYAMIERGGKFYERRHQIGFDGKETNVVEKQADFVIGSGNHARTYVYRAADGKLMEMPVSWYSERGGNWAMSPGYDRSDQDDFRREVPTACLFCHSAKADRPAAIDCQRCHGPGGAHATAAGSGHATQEAIRRAIVNPARLSRDRQLDVCMQCHLETTSRPLPNSIRHFDREPFSYRPGQPLGDYMTYFDKPTGEDGDRFEIAHAAYRLRKSACFRASQMTCTTCHNPHRPAQGQDYVAACRACHASAHSAEKLAGSCMDCHMPKRRAEDAVHVVMTDHYIQRRKPERDLVASLEERVQDRYRGPVEQYYPSVRDEIYLALAQVKDEANLAVGLPRLEQAIEKQKPARPELYFELGEAYRKAGKNAEAIRWYEQALRRQPAFSAAAKQLVVALFATGQTDRAIRILESAKPDAIVLTNLGNAYLRQGKRSQAETTLREALRLDPDAADAQNLFGLVRLQNGDDKGAEAAFREAIRLWPELAPAQNNLGSLLTSAHDYRQAEFHFQKAIRSDASYAEAHHGYGLLLILMGAYDKAAGQLREAARLDPDSAEIHSDLGDLLAAEGNTQGAEEQYRLAEQAKSADKKSR